MSTYKIGDLLPLIEEEANAQGVPPDLARAILISENSGDGVLRPNQEVSLTTQGIDPASGKPSGALGIFQVVPTTLRGLMQNKYITPDLNYGTLPGQIKAGIAAVKDAIDVSTRIIGKYDPLAAAAQYVNGGAGLSGYLGKGKMPEQATGYLKKVSKALGMDTQEYWGNEAKQLDYTTRYGTPAVTGALAQSTGFPALPNAGAYKDAMPGLLAMFKAMGLDVENSMTGSKEAVQKALEGTTAEITAAGDRSLQELQRDRNINALYGVDPSAQNSQLIDLLTQQDQERQKMKSLKPSIDELMAITPLQNPVKWLAAQFQLEHLVPQYNAAVQNKDTAGAAIANKYALAQQAKTLTPAVTVDTIQAEMMAKIKMAEAKAMAASAAVNMENVNARAKIATESMQWMAQDFHMDATLYRLKMDYLGIVKDAQAKADEQAILDRINDIRLKYGAPAIRTWKEFSMLPAEQKEALINATSGAANPGEAIRNMINFGSVNSLQSNPGTQAMADQAVQLYDSVSKKVDAYMLTHPSAKKQDVYAEEINKQYKVWRDELADGDITKASDDNPYRINVEQAAKSPALKNNKIAQWAAEAAQSMPASAIREKEILAQATARVNNGESVDVVSAELSQFFQEGYKYQFQTRGLGTLGFDHRMPNKKVEYSINSNIFGFFERHFMGAPDIKHPVDLMNPTSVKQFLIETQIKKMAKDLSAIPKPQELYVPPY